MRPYFHPGAFFSICRARSTETSDREVNTVRPPPPPPSKDDLDYELGKLPPVPPPPTSPEQNPPDLQPMNGVGSHPVRPPAYLRPAHLSPLHIPPTYSPPAHLPRTNLPCTNLPPTHLPPTNLPPAHLPFLQVTPPTPQDVPERPPRRVPLGFDNNEPIPHSYLRVPGESYKVVSS